MQELCLLQSELHPFLNPPWAGPVADVSLSIHSSSHTEEPDCRCGTMSGGGAGSAPASASRNWTGLSSAMGARPTLRPQVGYA